MKLVIDTNRIIASLIKNSQSRKIIATQSIQFITPDYTLEEILTHENTIRRKAKLTHEEYQLLTSLIFEHINIIPKEEYEDYLEIAKTLIEDVDDVPFIALCLATKADGIWSDDTHFHTQKQFTVYRTKNLILLL